MDMNLHPDADSFACSYCNLNDRPLSLDAAMLSHLIGEPSRLRITLMGRPEDVNREILNLYHCGYDIDAWSSPQRIPDTTEVISAYLKRSHF